MHIRCLLFSNGDLFKVWRGDQGIGVSSFDLNKMVHGQLKKWLFIVTVAVLGFSKLITRNYTQL